MLNKILNVIGIIVILALAIIWAIIIDPPEGVTYDCRLAEISPDFPIEVKNECRRRNK